MFHFVVAMNMLYFTKQKQETSKAQIYLGMIKIHLQITKIK